MNNKHLIYLFGITGILLLACLLLRQYQWEVRIKDQQMAQKFQQDSLGQALRQASDLQLLDQRVEALRQELAQSSGRILSRASINRLAILSQSFAPEGYNYLEPNPTYNFARAQLLLNLLQLDMDSVSFSEIKKDCSFAGADLEGAQLQGKNLSGIDLQSANLRNANLAGANLDRARLKGASLWGANLERARLGEALMHRVDLQWANLDSAQMPGAVMQGAKLNNARLRQTDLSCVILYYAEVRDAFFQGSNLESCNMFGSDISRSNFDQAEMNLFDVRMGVADEASFEGAKMWECKLREVSVEDGDFLKKLTDWEVAGAEEVQSRFELIKDPTKRSRYQIRIVEK